MVFVAFQINNIAVVLSLYQKHLADICNREQKHVYKDTDHFSNTGQDG